MLQFEPDSGDSPALPAPAARRTGSWFVPGTLALLALPLITGWIVSGMVPAWTDTAQLPRPEPGFVGELEVFAATAWACSADLVRQMFGRWLLPALGLCLVLQCRSVDLSVWMGFALGSAVGATAVQAGAHPVAAIAAVAGAGLALGLANAAAVSFARVPGVVATAASSLVCYGAAWLLTGGQPLNVNPEGLAIWSGPNWPTRLTAGLYVATMLTTLVLVRLSHRAGLSRRSALAAAMVGSGVLSALGGLCWLARSGEAPVPTWRLIDLSVIAAAVLAGAVVLRGPGRSLLAGVLLPPAMLVATVWQYEVWDVPDCPVAINLLALTGMVLAAQWAFVRSVGAGAARHLLCPALAAGGIAVVAVSVLPLPLGRHATAILGAAGAALWLAGTACALLRPRNGAPAGPAPGPE